MSSLVKVFIGVAAVILMFVLIGIVRSAVRQKQPSIPAYLISASSGEEKPNVDKFQRFYEEMRMYDSLCFFSIRGVPPTNEIKVDVQVPCFWQSFTENEGRIPSMMRQFVYAYNDSLVTSLSVNIKKLEKKVSDEEIEALRSEKNLKQMPERIGQYIASKPIELDTIKGVEIIYKNLNPRSNLPSYNLLVYYYYKNHIIGLGYTVVASNWKIAELEFNEHKNSFRMLASLTKIHP